MSIYYLFTAGVNRCNLDSSCCELSITFLDHHHPRSVYNWMIVYSNITNSRNIDHLGEYSDRSTFFNQNFLGKTLIVALLIPSKI